MTDPVPDGCVTCGAGPVEKILFPVAVHFKGLRVLLDRLRPGRTEAEGGRLRTGRQAEGQAA